MNKPETKRLGHVKKNPALSKQDEDYFKNKIQRRYVHNVIKVEPVQVSRVVIKAPSNIYRPDFNNDVGLWEQYWLGGQKLLERKITTGDL